MNERTPPTAIVQAKHVTQVSFSSSRARSRRRLFCATSSLLRCSLRLAPRLPLCSVVIYHTRTISRGGGHSGYRTVSLYRRELGVQSDVHHGLEDPRNAVGESATSDDRGALGPVRHDVARGEAVRNSPLRVT